MEEERRNDGAERNWVLRLVRCLFEVKLSRKATIVTQFVCAAVFALTSLAVGVYLFTLQPNTSFVVEDYGADASCRTGGGCEVSLQVTQALSSPVHVYYELEDFIANTREYIGSRSNAQLRGEAVRLGSNEARRCGAHSTNKEMDVTKSWNGTNLDPGALASPCGLQAKLFFRDTIEVLSQGRVLAMSEPQSAKQFQQGPSSGDTQWVDPSAARFEIWMTTSIDKKMTKLYGVVDEDMPPGRYTLRVREHVDYGAYGTRKNVRLTKINNAYGDSVLLGSMFVAGGAALLLIVGVRSAREGCTLKREEELE